VLEEGNREGWSESPLILGLGAVALVSLVTFVVHELETKDPVVDLTVFKNRTYVAGTGINLFTGLVLFGGSFLFSLFCGAVMRYDALTIGKVFLVSSSVQIVLMPLAGKLSQKIDPRIMLFFGLIVVAASQLVSSRLTAQAGFGDLVVPNMLRSVGLAGVFIPVSVVALSDLPAERRGNATGLFNLTRELGGSIGTALMGVVVSDGTKRHGAYLAEHVSVHDQATQETAAGLRALGAPSPEAILKLKVDLQALVLSFSDGFRLTSALILVGLVLVLLLRKPSPGVEVQGAH
jgi:DHA2 family multidrug resistance protein